MGTTAFFLEKGTTAFFRPEASGCLAEIAKILLFFTLDHPI
jgi:hypothetical protein